MTTTDELAAVKRIDPLEAIEMQALAIVENPPATPDNVLNLLDQAQAIEQRAGGMVKFIKQMLLQPYVKAHGQVEVRPGVKWVLKTDKKYKPRNAMKLMDALSAKAEGDYEAVLNCLSSNAFKHGECRKLLGDEFDAQFETVTKEDVELKESKKVLTLVNENFIRG